MPGREVGGSSRNIHPTLIEIREIIVAGLAARSIGCADSIARELTEAMRQRFAGGSVYFPLSAPQRLARDAQIYEQFDGRNHRALAVSFALSVKGVYEIIRRERQRRAGPNSPPPPDGRRKPRPPESW